MSVNKDCVVRNKKYILVPPDGGWGYMIWIAAAVNYSTTTMFVGSFGVIFRELYEDLDMGDTSVAMLEGTYSICLALAGYFTSPLLRLTSLQRLAVIAAFLFNLGAFCLIFVTSMLPLFICLGLLQGTGTGILYNLSWSLINDYFLEKRLLSFSSTQTVSAVATTIAPYVVDLCLHEYGHRGTLMIISGVSLHTLLAVALMQPVSRHWKKVEVPGEYTDEIKLLANNKQAKSNITTPIVKLTDTERNSFDFDAEVRRGDESCHFILALKDAVDVTILKKFLLSAAACGSTFCVFSEGIFTSLIQPALYSEGWREDIVARTVLWIAICDITTRMSFVLFNRFLKKINVNEMYLFGLLIAFVTRLGISWAQTQTVTKIFVIVTGVSRCTITVLQPLILADLFPGEFLTAMGTSMLVVGVLNLTLGPAISGVLYLTESYPTVFYILASFFGAVALLWSVELCYKRSKHKRRRMQRDGRRKTNNKVLRAGLDPKYLFLNHASDLAPGVLPLRGFAI